MSRIVLDLLQVKLGDLVGDHWAERAEQRGEAVAMYRRYMDGEHRSEMTPQMRKMLRLDMRKDGREEAFNANYCELVVDSITDRLNVVKVEGIVPDADTARVAGEDAEAPVPDQPEDPAKPLQDWADERMAHNRFDSLQADVHEAVMCDGDTFVMVSFNNETQRSEWMYEPAYDGDYGMIAVYDRMGRNIEAAIKIWWERGKQYVNVYFPDRVLKYEAVRRDPEEDVSGTMNEIEQPEWSLEPRDVSNTIPGVRTSEDGGLLWTDDFGEALGVPVVPFHNQRIGRAQHGKSAMESSIPMNDALNRTMVSMVMTGELTAFALLMGKGIEIPAGLTPGMSINIRFEDLQAANISEDVIAQIISAIDVKRIQPGELAPFIEQANFFINQIGTISRTPLPNSMGGDNASGESLKQREVGLVGKVKKAQIRLGNSWEDVMSLAHRVETAFANQAPPEMLRWNCVWDDAEVRNDSQFIKDVEEVADRIGEEETLNQLAQVFGWDDKKVQEIMDSKARQASRIAGAVDRQTPDYSRFSVPFRQPDANPNGIPTNGAQLQPATL